MNRIATDITALWLSSHAHLKPLAKHLPLGVSELRVCPKCSAAGAFHLLADLCLASEKWLRSAVVLYCPACESFHVADQHLAAIDDNPLVAVDARLWSSHVGFLNIEPTTRCNFKCWYCIGRHMTQADVEPASFSSMLDHAGAVAAIALVGEGEPLLHPDFFTMATQVRDSGRKVLMISNGSQLSNENIQRLCESEVLYIAVSIDSTRQDYFSRSRKHGNLSEVLDGMARLRAYRDTHGYTYPKLGIKGTLLDYNAQEMIEIIKLARDHGAETFERFQPLNPKCSYAAIYPPEEQAQLGRVSHISEIVGGQLAAARRILQPTEEFLAQEGILLAAETRANPLRPHCDPQYAYALLSGDMTPCCQVKSQISADWNLANRPLSEILRDPAYETMRFNLWNGIFPDDCAGCVATPVPPA